MLLGIANRGSYFIFRKNDRLVQKHADWRSSLKKKIVAAEQQRH